MVFLHAGLLSVVVSPLARKPGWGDEAKVCGMMKSRVEFFLERETS